MECFRCQAEDHLSRDCPTRTPRHAAPPPDRPSGGDRGIWCGTCDEHTRQIALTPGQDLMARCPECHPLRDKLLPQHRRCGECRRLVHVADQAECSQHLPIGPRPYVGPPARPSRPQADPQPNPLVEQARADHSLSR
jgi:hypothetical protein